MRTPSPQRIASAGWPHKRLDMAPALYKIRQETSTQDHLMKIIIGVVGDSDPGPEISLLAEATGAAIARAGAVLVCGGLGGVMCAAARGAKEADGLTVGVLPSYDAKSANPFIDIPVVTGMGHARNAIIAATAQALVALPGSHGTLSEIALGLKLGRRVIALGRESNPEGVILVSSPEEAVRMALDSQLGRARHGHAHS